MFDEVTGRLENWYISNQNVYGIPMACIHGYIYDDVYKRWCEGAYISTSSLKSDLSECVEGNVVLTKNSKYLLGKPLEVKEEQMEFNFERI